MDWAQAFTFVGCSWAVAAVLMTYFDCKKNSLYCRFVEPKSKPYPGQVPIPIKKNGQ